jgi:putative transposase
MRLPRLFAPGIPSHVTVRGNNHQDIFLCDGDRMFFRSCLQEGCEKYGARIHAYVLMTNHVHLLAMGETSTSIPKLIQSVGRRYVGYFNARYARSGTLWEGRYRATLVETDYYFLACHRYIDLNPVRVGMAAHPAQYLWSSHRRYAGDTGDDLVTPHEVIEALGKTPEDRAKAYQALFETPLDDVTLQRIRYGSRYGWALGSTAFCRRLEQQGARRTAPLKSGRRKRGSRREG